MRGWICFVCWCSVIVSVAAGAEPALHGIPYKPDPPPAIDGRLDEWENVPNAYTIQTREQVAYGGKAWKSPQDLSAKVWLAWRGEYLYLAADVTDDRHVQKERGRDMWRGDHVELYLDASPDAGPAAKRLGRGANLPWGSARETCNTRAILLTDIPPEAAVFTPEGGSAEGVLVAAQKTEKGYALEAAVPWALVARLGQDARPEARQRHAAQFRGGHLRHRRARAGPGKADDDSHHPLGPRAQPAHGGGPGAFGRQAARAWSAAWTWPRGRKLPRGRKQQIRFQTPPAPKGKEGVLVLKARLDTPQRGRIQPGHAAAAQRPDGRSAAAREPAARARRAVGGRMMNSRGGRHLQRSLRARLRRARPHRQYALRSGAKLCLFELRVSDLLRPGDNVLVDRKPRIAGHQPPADRGRRPPGNPPAGPNRR